jgi:hypothetical protein
MLMKSSRTIGSKQNNTGNKGGKQRRRTNNNPSQKQLEQRAKFATAIHFTRTLANLLTETFTDYTHDKPGINKAISQILKGAITGTYPDYRIDYSAVFISRGLLPGAIQATASSDLPGTIRFDWTNRDLLAGIAKPTDKVVMVAYCPDCNRSVYRKGASRSALTDTLSARGFKNKTVYTWLAFVSEDESDMSDSIFTGEITVKD